MKHHYSVVTYKLSIGLSGLFNSLWWFDTTDNNANRHLWAVCTQAGAEDFVGPIPHILQTQYELLLCWQKVQNPKMQTEPFQTHLHHNFK